MKFLKRAMNETKLTESIATSKLTNKLLLSATSQAHIDINYYIGVPPL